MKVRYLIAVLALMMASLVATAETHYKPHIWIGGRAGATLSRMSFSPAVKQSWALGSTGAVTFRYSEEKLFGLIAELGWAQRGWKENYEEHPFDYTRSITYVNLPILTHIYFGSRRFKCFINLGPEFGLYLSDKITANFDYKNPAAVPDYPRNRRTEQLSMPVTGKFDYGICASIGFEFYLQPRHSVALETRYYFGLGNIYPATKADIFGASRNMTIAATVAYNFRLK